jgi:hypothetical protein
MKGKDLLNSSNVPSSTGMTPEKKFKERVRFCKLWKIPISAGRGPKNPFSIKLRSAARKINVRFQAGQAHN